MKLEGVMKMVVEMVNEEVNEVKNEVSAERIAEIKEEFIENLWEMEIVRPPAKSNQKLPSGKWVEHRLKCTNEKFNYYLKGLANSIVFRNDILEHSDIYQEAALAVQLAMNTFKGKGKDDWDWEKFHDKDEAHLSYLFAYLKGAVSRQVSNFEDIMNHTKSAGQYEEGEDGEEYNVTDYTSMSVSSYDKEFTTEDGTTASIMSLLSEDQGLYHQHEGNTASHMLHWIRDNKDKVLNKNQREFYELMVTNYHKRGEGNYTVSGDLARAAGVSDDTAWKRKDRIFKKLLKEYNKEFPFGEKTQRQLYKEKNIKLFTPFIDLVYCEEDDILQQNKLLSNWIIENMDQPILNDIIYDNLLGEDIFNLVKGYNNQAIPAKTLYKLVDLIEEHLNKLEMMDISATKFYIKESEKLGGGAWTKERHKEYADYKLAFSYPDLFHFDSETKELTQIVDELPKWYKDKKKKYKKSRLLPGGAVVSIEDEEGYFF